MNNTNIINTNKVPSHSIEDLNTINVNGKRELVDAPNSDSDNKYIKREPSNNSSLESSSLVIKETNKILEGDDQSYHQVVSAIHQSQTMESTEKSLEFDNNKPAKVFTNLATKCQNDEPQTPVPVFNKSPLKRSESMIDCNHAQIDQSDFMPVNVNSAMPPSPTSVKLIQNSKDPTLASSMSTTNNFTSRQTDINAGFDDQNEHF